MEKCDKNSLMSEKGCEYNEEYSHVEMPDELLELISEEKSSPKEKYVYVTKSGKTFHTNENCRILKSHDYTKIPFSEIGDRTPCKMCNKVSKKK